MELSDVSDWLSNATNFRQKYADYQNAVAALKASSVDATKYPDLANERADLLSRSDALNSKISGTVSAIESTYQAAKDFILNPVGTIATGAETAWDWAKSELGLEGLGFLPVLIPVAVIGAAVAGIVYWMDDYATLNKKVAEQKRLEATGMSPAKAAEIVQKTFGSVGGGLFSNVKTIAYIGLAGAALFVGYQVFVKGKKQ